MVAPAWIGWPSQERALQSKPLTRTLPVWVVLLISSSTGPDIPMMLSALVGTLRKCRTFPTRGRVAARATADTRKNTSSWLVPEQPQRAAMVAATAPRQNQMLTS